MFLFSTLSLSHPPGWKGSASLQRRLWDLGEISHQERGAPGQGSELESMRSGSRIVPTHLVFLQSLSGAFGALLAYRLLRTVISVQMLTHSECAV